MQLHFQKELASLKNWTGISKSGVVKQITGLLIESIGPSVHLGEICMIYNKEKAAIPCEVVGFKDDRVLLMSMGEMTYIAPGSEVYPTRQTAVVPVSKKMCGRVVDALGNPIDGKGAIQLEQFYPLAAPAPKPMERPIINQILPTGVKAIDATCTIGLGQRIGIYSAAGVGKSLLLGMIANMSTADVNVIALIGERGREVREFIENSLGTEGMARSIVVAVTSDQPALLRVKGAQTAMAIAEYFRDNGKNVILMMDSITRYAFALREIGLAVGEPTTTKGYTPSVFAALPKLLERSGRSKAGVITAIFSVLVEADDLNDPIADTLRAILDGHIILSRRLAAKNQYPAIDVLESLSRLMVSIVPEEVYRRSGIVRELLQTYKEAEDLINIGAYVPGSSQKIDKAIRLNDKLKAFLRQAFREKSSFEMTQHLLEGILREV